MKARLHPHWVGGRAGYVYSAIFDGELLIEGSRDPECDAARALMAKGITGSLSLCDSKTGIPRTIINIEKAAKLAIREDRTSGPRFVKWRPMTQEAKEACDGERRSPEADAA